MSDDEFDPSVYDGQCSECGALYDPPSPEFCQLCGGDVDPLEDE